MWAVVPHARIGNAMTATPRTDEGTNASSLRDRTGPVRVLVVDPCPDGADSLALLLSVYGCAAAVAYSVSEGADLASRFAPDLILVDLGRSDEDGRDLPGTLDGVDRPLVIAVADLAGADARRRSERAGFDRHLLKPVSPDDLLELLAVVEFRHTHSRGR